MSSADPLPASSAVSVSSSVSRVRRQSMPGEHRRQAKPEAPVTKQAGRKVDRDAEARLLAVDASGRDDGLFQDKVGELADAVVLFGSGDELGRRDRALLGMGPAGERFGADDPAL